MIELDLSQYDVGVGGYYRVKRIQSDETRNKIGNALRGKSGTKHTAESKAKISAARKGTKRGPQSDSQKQAASDAMTKRWGLVHTPAGITTMTEAAKLLNTNRQTINNRIKNDNFPDYYKILVK